MYGRPVIAPGLGGMAEKVDHGVTGMLFKPDSLESAVELFVGLANNHDLLQALSVGALNRSKRSFRMLPSHQAFYQSLLS